MITSIVYRKPRSLAKLEASIATGYGPDGHTNYGLIPYRIQSIGAVKDRISAIGGVMGPIYKAPRGVTNVWFLFNCGPDIGIGAIVIFLEVYLLVCFSVFSHILCVMECLACAGCFKPKSLWWLFRRFRRLNFSERGESWQLWLRSGQNISI